MLAAAGFALIASVARAGIRPSFEMETSTWDATDIVLVTVGDKIDGTFTVLETWKGNLKPGAKVKVPELADFASEESRTIHIPFGEKDGGTKVVSCKAMILFLKKAPEQEKPTENSEKKKEDPIEWLATSWGGMKTSVAWFEAGQSYAYVQWINPGPSELIPYGLSEKEFRAKVTSYLDAAKAIQETGKIANGKARADALKKFAVSEERQTRRAAFNAMGEIGQEAVPELQSMLQDESLLAIHPDAIDALAKAGADKIGKEWIKIIEIESAFWKETAPTLDVHWWNDFSHENDPKRNREYLRKRYSRTYRVFLALQTIKCLEALEPATQFAKFWRSLPQLGGDSPHDQMNEALDAVIKHQQ
jgi:hypothetical protein